MTARAVILGLLLGLGVSASTYFNDWVIRQTMLIGNHLPIAIFGTAVILLVVVNPLLRAAGPRFPLRGGEIALITAIGLAACAWPGSNFFRGFANLSTMPSHLVRTEASWRGAQVMSYVPGGSAEIAAGHVQNWPVVIQRLESPPDEAAQVMHDLLSRPTRTGLRELSGRGQYLPDDVRNALNGLNADLVRPTTDEYPPERVLHVQLSDRGLLPTAAERPLGELADLQARIETLRARRGELRGPPGAEPEESADEPTASGEDEAPLAEARTAEEEAAALRRRELGEIDRELTSLVGEARQLERHANRAAISAAFGDAMLPPPRGEGVLLAGGRADPVAVDALLEGRDDGGVMDVPWSLWWPSIWMWGGLALLAGASALCLALIVHPQWSRRELLAYPIARFVEEISERKPGAWLPGIASNRVFWYAFAALLALHLVNGLHAWFSEPWPEIPRQFDLNPLRELFPNASRVAGSFAYFHPTIFPSVIAFTFFLTTSVSFSLGIAQALYMTLAAGMLMYGMTLESDYLAGQHANLLRFGGYVGFALMIAYTGRRYYLNVAGSAVGLPRQADTPVYAVWAARGLVLAVVLAVVWLQQAGLDWLLAVAFIAMTLLMFLVLARIVAETGAFFLQAWWMPVGVLTTLFGIEAIGPTMYIVLAMASVMIVGDPREALMPYLTNGLQMADRAGKQSPGRMAPWLALIILAGFGVALVATLTLQYRHGVAGVDDWTRQHLPSMPFRELASHVSELGARGVLAEATAISGLERLTSMRPEPGMVWWGMLGLALVIGTASARLRLPWWPLHPVAFLVWGTYPLHMFTASFLLGWLIKASVMQLGGAKGYHVLKPVMIGVIAGELFAGLMWMGVGTVYYFNTGQTPTTYSIFPT